MPPISRRARAAGGLKAGAAALGGPNGCGAISARFRLGLAAALIVAAVSTGCAAPVSPVPGYTLGAVLAQDDFSSELGGWRSELEKGGRVTAHQGRLEIDVSGGCTVWLAKELSGPLLITYEATAVAEGGVNDRVSDLNCFWMAQDARSPGDLFATVRSGKFSDYDRLRCYYVGLGGNSNTTTRFRRYVGETGNRPLRPEDDLSTAEYLLVRNVPQTIQLVAADGLIAYYRNGRRIFSMTDRAPYVRGWFGFRTVDSHLRISRFSVCRLVRE